MRTLIILRGLPCSGKTTWIKQNKLEDYTLSPDDLRTMMSSPILNADGTLSTNQGNNDRIMEIIYEMLETRMKQGASTIIDATHLGTESLKRYKKLCNKYGYGIIGVVDFTHVSYEECCRRNAERLPEHRRVPQHTMEWMKTVLEKSTFERKCFRRIDPRTAFEFDTPDSLFYGLQHIDFNKGFSEPPKKIYVFGDIHGCFDIFKQEFEKVYSPENVYIFCGDYLDRGDKNVETLKYILDLREKCITHTYFIEGNHESHLRNWSNGQPSYSRFFNENTAKELNTFMSSKDRTRTKAFVRSLRPCMSFDFGEGKYFACHGGISSPKQISNFTSASTFIKGSGKYEDGEKVCETWKQNCEGRVQFFGHRVIGGDKEHCKVNDCVYTLDGRVEIGDNLKYCEILPSGEIVEHVVKNTFHKENSNTEISEV